MTIAKTLVGVALILASHPLGNFAAMGEIAWYAPYITFGLGLLIVIQSEIIENAGISGLRVIRDEL